MGSWFVNVLIVVSEIFVLLGVYGFGEIIKCVGVSVWILFRLILLLCIILICVFNL